MDGSNSTVANAADRGQIYQLLRAFGRFSRCIRNVRSGSIATEMRCPRHVRFPPNSDQIADITLGPFGADFVAEVGDDRCVATGANFFK
jgi:hypothetical protein